MEALLSPVLVLLRVTKATELENDGRQIIKLINNLHSIQEKILS